MLWDRCFSGTYSGTYRTQGITEGEFLRLDEEIDNLISGNHFCFRGTKQINMVTHIIFGITITFGDWATNILKKMITTSGKNQTVRKIMTYNKNPSTSIDINSALLTLRFQYE